MPPQGGGKERENLDFETYLEGLQGKTAAVIGIGVSNRPLIELLLRRHVAVTARDRKSWEALGPLADELAAMGCRFRLGEDYLQDLTEDIIFRTPGLRPDVPEIAAAVARGSVLTSEMEAFFEVCPCHMIAITGSDGKTTTSTIISELLKAEDKTVWLGGNIGHPLLCDTPRMRPEDYAVLELSSFQLMTMKRSPAIAVVTNLSPNHLDVHKSYQEYIEAKEPYKLLKHAFAENIDSEGHSHVAFWGTLQHTDTIFKVSGEGNGPIDAFFNAIKDEKMSHFTFLDYSSHAITDGSDSQGVAYILLQDQRTGKKYWGVGLSHNINLAPLRAILSAINRSKRS